MEIAEKNQPKKFFIIVFMLLVLLVILSNMKLPVNAEESLPAVITVSNTQGKTGDEVSVEVSIFDNPGIAGHKFILEYDASRLEYTGRNKTEVGAGDVVLPINEVNAENDGRIVVIGYDVEDSDANGLLFTLKFKIISGLSGDIIDGIDFRFICADLKNVDNNNIGYKIEQGRILILSELGLALNKDEKYIVSQANIDNGDKTVYMQVIGKEKITIESFKNTYGLDIRIEYENGDEVDIKKHPLLGTGMRIIKGDEVIVVVIENDLTGNGESDIEDAKVFLEFLVGNKILEGAYALAVRHYDEPSAIRKLRAFLTAVLNN